MNGNDPVTRRRFLGGLACGAMAGAAPGISMGAEKKKWRMKLSTSSIHFSSLPIEQACERIAELGFEAIDIWAKFGNCTHLDDVDARLGAEGLKALLEKHKLKISAFSVYSSGYARYAKLLGEVGGGVAIQGSTGGLAKPEELTAKMKTFLESLKPLAELAEEHNSYLAIENHGGALLHTHDSFKAFVDLNPYKRVGVAMAPYHLESANADIPKVIETVGKQLLFFYAWQKQADTAQLPGIGTTDFTPMVAALGKVRYSRYVNPFMHQEQDPETMFAALKKSRAYMQECYKKAM